jgi:hypothetical protein
LFQDIIRRIVLFEEIIVRKVVLLMVMIRSFVFDQTGEYYLGENNHDSAV